MKQHLSLTYLLRSWVETLRHIKGILHSETIIRQFSTHPHRLELSSAFRAPGGSSLQIWSTFSLGVAAAPSGSAECARFAARCSSMFTMMSEEKNHLAANLENTHTSQDRLRATATTRLQKSNELFPNNIFMSGFKYGGTIQKWAPSTALWKPVAGWAALEFTKCFDNSESSLNPLLAWQRAEYSDLSILGDVSL